ncbi:MAG: caspase family protein [Holophagales bacterium]|nr:caspase family protein [Holophagales bacterium]
MSSPKTWALLVGINDYPHFDAASRLRGTLADVDAMASLLRERAPGLHLRILRDSQATRAAVLEAWRWLEAEARADDEVLFYWAGHGSQVRDDTSDERDGWDETLVPHDSGRREHPNRDLVDDEIRHWLHRLSAKTRNVALIIDACHSGTAARTGVRTVPRDPQPRSTPAPRIAEAGVGPADWLGLPPGCVLLSACRDDQKAIEPLIGGQKRGAFTWALEQAIREAPAEAAWRDLFAVAESQVAVATFGAQVPQIEGAGRRESILAGPAPEG